MRKLIFWIHLTAGVIAGLVILIMSVTGVVLTYEKQMIAWSDRTDAARPPDTGAERLPIDDLLKSVQASGVEGPVTGFTVSSIPDAPALATVGQRIFKVNAYTGSVLGESSPRLRVFFRSVTSWHRYLAVEGPWRPVSRAITGWGNLLFLLIVIGGPILWLPKKWTATQIKAIALFRGGLRAKARDFNWHNAIGIWSCVPLALIVLGAMPISFPWANNAVYRLVGEAPPAPAGGAAGGRGQGAGPRADGAPQREAGRGEARADAGQRPALEPLWVKAERQVDGWRTIGARFGGNPNAPVAFTIDRGIGGQPQLRGTLTVDRATGDVVRWEPYESQSTGRRLRTFLRFAHTGEFFGVIGQTIAGLATAGAVVLVWTGLALALRRFVAWRARRASASAPFRRSTAA